MVIIITIISTTSCSVSTASVVIFMNQPLHDRHIEISKTFDIELIPFDLKEMDSSYQNYHPSTLRWILIYNYFFLVSYLRSFLLLIVICRAII